MLIYNFQKEFLGIDEEDLQALGFSDLAELRSESADFADMFVKTPGHVHNFAHVHWIDFITCAEYNESSKVIIHANGKNFKCNLDIKTAYLVDNPSQKAYLVYLNSLRELSDKEDNLISRDLYDKPSPKATTATNPIFKTPEFNQEFKEHTPKEESSYFEDDYYDSVAKSEPEPFDEYETYQESSIELDIHKEFPEPAKIDKKDKKIESISEDIIKTEEKPTSLYNPEIASKALGLPIDLIEEFLQDFIIQSKDFKNELYESLESDDFSNVKILSHKLKGVAANLRVEDALDTLTVINASDDKHEINANLSMFYKIIANLSGEQPEEENIAEEKPSEIAPVIDPYEEEAPTYEEPTIEEQAPAYEEPIIEEKTANTIDKDEDEFIISFKDDEPLEPLTQDIKPDEASKTITQDVEPYEPLETMTHGIKPDLTEEDEPFELALKEEEEEEDFDSPYNKSQSASEIGLDLICYDELFIDYIKESEEVIRSINKAIEENDAYMWKKHAIKLKGMSDNMRVNLFSKELEIMSSTQDINKVSKAIDNIEMKLKEISTGEG